MAQSITALSEKAAEDTQQQSWYVYIIENRLDQLYTGITTDPQRRFKEHQSNTLKAAKSLRGKGPLTLRYCLEVKNQSQALQVEYWIKQQTKPRKLRIINGLLNPLCSVSEATGKDQGNANNQD